MLEMLDSYNCSIDWLSSSCPVLTKYRHSETVDYNPWVKRPKLRQFLTWKAGGSRQVGQKPPKKVKWDKAESFQPRFWSSIMFFYMSFRIASIRNNILVGRCQVVQPAKPICPGPCCHLTYRRCHCWRIVLLFIKPTHGCAYILFILYATLNNWYIISYIMFWGKQVIKRKNIYQTFVLFYQDPKKYFSLALLVTYIMSVYNPWLPSSQDSCLPSFSYVSL